VALAGRRHRPVVAVQCVESGLPGAVRIGVDRLELRVWCPRSTGSQVPLVLGNRYGRLAVEQDLPPVPAAVDPPIPPPPEPGSFGSG
jgi:hypothetical protein